MPPRPFSRATWRMPTRATIRSSRLHISWLPILDPMPGIGSYLVGAKEPLAPAVLISQLSADSNYTHLKQRGRIGGVGTGCANGPPGPAVSMTFATSSVEAGTPSVDAICEVSAGVHWRQPFTLEILTP